MRVPRSPQAGGRNFVRLHVENSCCRALSTRASRWGVARARPQPRCDLRSSVLLRTQTPQNGLIWWYEHNGRESSRALARRDRAVPPLALVDPSCCRKTSSLVPRAQGRGGRTRRTGGGPLLSVRGLRGLRNNIYKNSSNWMLRFYVENTPGGRRGPLWGREKPREVVPKRHKIELFSYYLMFMMIKCPH